MAFKKLKLWFDAELAESLANKIIAVGTNFNKDSFLKALVPQLDKYELKDRVELIADALYSHISGSYSDKILVLKGILGAENNNDTGMFKEYYWIMPIAKLVEKYGLDHYTESLDMMIEITKRNTSEYAIRPFVIKYEAQLLSDLLELCSDHNFHIRRLCVEGIRPRLPWASKLSRFIENPSPILPILEALKNDPSRYVQKSVANTINDILKDNPEIAKTILEKWSIQPTNERKWIVKHAMRNALKKKEQWAVDLL